MSSTLLFTEKETHHRLKQIFHHLDHSGPSSFGYVVKNATNVSYATALVKCFSLLQLFTLKRGSRFHNWSVYLIMKNGEAVLVEYESHITDFPWGLYYPSKTNRHGICMNHVEELIQVGRPFIKEEWVVANIILVTNKGLHKDEAHWLPELKLVRQFHE